MLIESECPKNAMSRLDSRARRTVMKAMRGTPSCHFQANGSTVMTASRMPISAYSNMRSETSLYIVICVEHELDKARERILASEEGLDVGRFQGLKVCPPCQSTC